MRFNNVVLNVQGFSWEECDLLVNALLKNIGLLIRVHSDRGKPKLYVLASSLQNFYDIVRLFIKDYFLYKIEE